MSDKSRIELFGWLLNLSKRRWGDVQNVISWEEGKDEDGRTAIDKIKFYTNDNVYNITAQYPKDSANNVQDDCGYLGCTVNKRKFEPGEDWARGNDLADGAFSKETFDDIVLDVLAFELQQLSYRDRDSNKVCATSPMQIQAPLIRRITDLYVNAHGGTRQGQGQLVASYAERPIEYVERPEVASI